MQEFEFDYRSFSNRQLEDNKLFVQFFSEAVQDDAKTEEQGRPIFRDAVFVRIVVPGDRNNIVVREADPADFRRFAAQYKAYQEGGEDAVVGTPLREWPFITRAQAEELRYLGVRTVEALAELSDAAKQKVAGLTTLSKRAQDWLATAKDAEVVTKMRTELEARDNQIQVLTQNLASLADEIKAMRAERAGVTKKAA